MDWVRCNMCYAYSNPVTRICIYLTSCGHFVCNRCLGDSNVVTNGKTTCKICSQQCSMVKLIPNQLNPQVRYYFGDTISVLKKVVQTAEFQKTHREANFELRRRARMLVNIRELDEKVEKVKKQRQLVEEVLPKMTQLAEFVRQEATNTGINPSKIALVVNSTPPQQQQQQQQSQTSVSQQSSADNSNASTIRGGASVGGSERRVPLKRTRTSPFQNNTHQSTMRQDNRKTTPQATPTGILPKRVVQMTPNETQSTPKTAEDVSSSHGSINLMTQVQQSQKRRLLTTPTNNTPTKLNFNVPYPSGVIKSTPVKHSTTLDGSQLLTPQLNSQQAPSITNVLSSSQRNSLQDPSPKFKELSGGSLGIVQSATVRSTGAAIRPIEPVRLAQPSSQVQRSRGGGHGQCHSSRAALVQQSPFYSHRDVNQQQMMSIGSSRPMVGHAPGVMNTGLTGSGNVFLRPSGQQSQHVDMTKLRTPRSEITAATTSMGSNNYYQLINRGTPK